jgi:hypothetical protein
MAHNERAAKRHKMEARTHTSMHALASATFDLGYGFTLEQCTRAAAMFPDSNAHSLADILLNSNDTFNHLMELGIDHNKAQDASLKFPTDIVAALDYITSPHSSSSSSSSSVTRLQPLEPVELNKVGLRSLLLDLLKLKSNSKNQSEVKEEQLYSINDPLCRFYSHLLVLEKLPNGEQQQTQQWTVCQVCFSDSPVPMANCGHSNSCLDCLNMHFKARMSESLLPPWIPCLEPSCKFHVDIRNLLDACEMGDVIQAAVFYLRRVLKRESDWVLCQKDSCEMGFWFQERSSQQTCELCGMKQQVKKREDVADVGLDEMIKKGVMKPCPRCKQLAMKDYGMCNVMHCHECGIYWNWKSLEVGNSYDQVKQRARMNGTMWEPGELEYQRRLERQNPEEFRRLLEKNGIKYDPNYVRGTR